jgi:hypothetical protein
LNKATTEAQERTRLAAEIAASMGKPLTNPAPAGAPAPMQRVLMKDRLCELAEIAIGAAAFHQPSAPGQRENPNANWGEFRAWVELASKIVDKAADFQSPKYRAVLMGPVPEERPVRPITDGNVIDINDPIAASRVYARIVSASKAGR